MFSSLTVSVVFTMVFVVTGGWALYRLATGVSGADPDVDRAAELAHLLMSLAMVGMVWGRTGGPESTSGIVQLAAFGLFALWFGAGTVAGSLPSSLHLVNTAAMVWMVAAMPQLMGVTPGSGAVTHHHMPGMTAPPAAPGPASVPVVVVTLLFTALLLVAAALWGWRAGRPEPAPAGADPVAVLVLVATRRRTTARLDACCHLLMSLGMAAMLAAML